ncbi:Type II secretion system protein F [bioreactor metagenome]|uniref:Bacterial general secretion pathway protein f signature n=2 Tax=root TaxID=1 RepID=A0A1W1IGI2_9LACT|nr:type II secretion system F family protein [Trichococcus pasteurii]SFE63398.1 type IV pilus assembly protein PilC [Trichococcus pasteurii]SLM52134.1 bacterial general secretion pathway protein f signature [Trichococcus pasteurii]SSB93015.1 bacterial general secretion pathway protein f signature [Trichococcus pasteurii]
MAVFAYKAKTRDGKLMKGKIEGTNKKEALNELRHMDLIVFEVDALNAVLNKDINFRTSLKSKDFIVFLRQFSSLMNAGILLVDALDLLAAQSTSLALKEALEELSEEIREGVALSEAMAKKPKLFPDLLIHMIHSAEVSGRLEEVLQQMADYYEKQHRIKQKISTAMTYPLVVSVLAFLITAFLLVFIVPIFGDMFASMGSELPAITRMVLTLSGLLQYYWWMVLLLMGLLAAVIIQLGKKEQVAYVFDVLQLKVPILGMFIQKTLLARMTQTLSSLINSSVPILQAIEVTSKVVGNRVVENVLLQAQKDVEQGESLAKPMVDHWFFPPLIIQMIQVGESSGELDEMLKKVSEIYDQEVQEASDKMQALIEPIMIIFLSGVVGVIVLSIVVPMFSMFETFG